MISTFKIIGSGLIFTSLTYIGMVKSIRLKRREEYLRNVISFLNILDIQISYSSDKLEQCMEKADSTLNLGKLLKYTVEHIHIDGVRKAWTDGVKCCTPYLSNDDREILSGLGTQLGMTDRESQYKNIHCVCELMKKQHSMAQQECRQLCRMYEGGGALAGIFAVILLI